MSEQDDNKAIKALLLVKSMRFLL